ncbi:MAG TPA: hypothetical protein PKD85_02185 [Saprospiraceae bacterium]|nr:hypothetical protein [Saprospiraceae bacterium]
MEIIFNEYKGLIRVGRITYIKGRPIHPRYEGFTPIVVLTKCSEYGDIGPYVLKDKDNIIMENKWQFSKVYPWVPEIEQTYSKWDNTIIWKHPKERHMDGDILNDKYWEWRKKGFEALHAIRYPVGNTTHKKMCKYVLSDDGRKLGIYEGRRDVYLKTYVELVKKESKFKQLKKRLQNYENLLIIEVDGPHQESLSYYKDTYEVNDDFIENDTILVTMKNMDIMIKDPKHSFGHGYCLAMALMGWE